MAYLKDSPGKEGTGREHRRWVKRDGTPRAHWVDRLEIHQKSTPEAHKESTPETHLESTPEEYTGRALLEGLQSGEGAAAVAVDAEAEGVVEADVTYIHGFPEGREGIEH